MKRHPWHTVLIALYSVLFLFSENIDIIEASDLWVPLGSVLLGSAVTFIISYAILRKWSKAGIVTTVIVLLFFSYGHYYDSFYLPRKLTLNSRFEYDLYIWSSIIISLSVLLGLYRTKSDLFKLNSLFNFISFLLISMPLYKIGAHVYSNGNQTVVADDDVSKETLYSKTRPNIYYLIMDAYGRNDVLREYYGYDNSAFTDSLKEIGFYVADRSFANYNMTILSVPSSLNMMYLDSLSSLLGADSKDKDPLSDLVNDNRTFRRLRQFGYSVIAFDAQIWHFLFLEDADTLYRTPDAYINLFQTELYNLSIMRAFDKRRTVSAESDEYESHRKKILAAFDRIVEISSNEGPFYVHGHILSPHQPFVFDENGIAVTPDYPYSIWYTVEDGRDPVEYRKQYMAQLKFINKKLIETVKAIIENSKVPPIIIIQGDHGPSAGLTSIGTIEGNSFKERMPILNAYYFPDRNYGSLYPGISPVNSFRTIFSQYFNLDYPLLNDSSFYSTWNHVYDFVNVTDSIAHIP